jgi:glucose/arabinose dehydrogenase
MNERDNLGDDLVPDYATSVKDGGFYGWPYSYIGKNYDPRYAGAFPDLVNRAIVPDVLLPAHSAALGITFYDGTQFPQRYRNGGFVALHGSWNRSIANGYKVVFFPMANGRPDRSEDFVSGMLASNGENGTAIEAWGRPGGRDRRARRLAARVGRWLERDLEDQRQEVSGPAEPGHYVLSITS